MKKYIFNSAFLLLFLAIIATPVFTMDVSGEVSPENRKLMARPAFPGFKADSKSLRSFTLNVESWLNDRIGFRSMFMAFYARFTMDILKTSPHIQITRGRDGYVFLAAHAAAEQSRDSLSKDVLGVPRLEQQTVDDLVREISQLGPSLSVYGAPVILVTIPQKQLLDYDKLPFYIRRFVTPDIIERPLDLRVAEALPDSVKLVFPYAEARQANAIDRLYPQKNFHWIAGRYTKLMAAKIAETFEVAAYEDPGLDEFNSCAIPSDISHIAGFPMTGQGYLCYKNDVFQRLGIEYANVLDSYPQLDFLQYPIYIRNANKVNDSKLLWMGDSFSSAVGADLARHFGEVISIDSWYEKDYSVREKLDLRERVKKLVSVYKPDYVVISQHDIMYLIVLVKALTPAN